jgi:hypothetical protein
MKAVQVDDGAAHLEKIEQVSFRVLKSRRCGKK